MRLYLAHYKELETYEWNYEYRRKQWVFIEIHVSTDITNDSELQSHI